MFKPYFFPSSNQQRRRYETFSTLESSSHVGFVSIIVPPAPPLFGLFFGELSGLQHCLASANGPFFCWDFASSGLWWCILGTLPLMKPGCWHNFVEYKNTNRLTVPTPGQHIYKSMWFFFSMLFGTPFTQYSETCVRVRVSNHVLLSPTKHTTRLVKQFRSLEVTCLRIHQFLPKNTVTPCPSLTSSKSL